MRLPLQNDNSSIVVNMHRCFKVDAHFFELDDKF